MKILHIVTGLDIGGAEIMLFRLCKQQISDGDHVVVVSLKSGGLLKVQFLEENIPVYELGFPRGKISFSGFNVFINLLKESRPDVIHSWMYHANLIASLASLFTGNIPVVWAIHNTTLSTQKSSKLTILIMKFLGLISFLPKCIVYCSLSSKSLHEKYLYAKKKGKFIPNGVDTNLFSPNDNCRNDKFDGFHIDSNHFVIGMIGRYDSQKDHANFIQAADIIMQQHQKAQFVLCGPGVDESNDEIMKLISNTSIPLHFHLIGPRFDIENVHNSFDLFMLTSSYGEAFPIVLAEAMSCGVPCVSTDVGDAAYIIDETGLVVPPKDPQALADAVEQLLSLSEDEFNQLKVSARKRIIENFSLKKIASLYKETYELILKRE